MKKTNKILTSALTLALFVSLTACSVAGGENQATNTVPVEVQELSQCDYRGGLKRTASLKENVMSVIDDMKSNNIVVRKTSPNSFWTADGYQDFVSTFLEQQIISDTEWLNEEQTDWETVLGQYKTSRFANESGNLGIEIVRLEKDDYYMQGIEYNKFINGASTIGGESYKYATYLTGKADYRVLYDCDKDWCKAYGTMAVDALSEFDQFKKCTVELFEYQRIDNDTFAIQTSNERLLIKLKPSEKDTIISEREIKEFYYSKLASDCMRTTYTPSELLDEKDLLTHQTLSENVRINEKFKEHSYLNMDGDLSYAYGAKESMFFRASNEITPAWVFEDGSQGQAICYKDGILVATTYNKLSGNYERFIYKLTNANESIIGELESLVVISNLVGTNEETETKPETENSNNDNLNNATSIPTQEPVNTQEPVQSTQEPTQAPLNTQVPQSTPNSVE